MDLIGPKAIGLLLTPPGVILVIALLGFLLRIKWSFLGNFLVIASLLALLFLSLPLTGKRLMSQLEAQVRPLALEAKEAKPAGAIVILGGGRYANAPEYGADTVSAAALERLRYGAYLHRQTGLPILVSGGAPFGEATPEAVLMKEVLERDFSVKPRWVESASRTTRENALRVAEIMAGAGVRRIYLVTHAAHMPRALWSFVNTGLDAIPAPMGFTTLSNEDRSTLGYLPSAHGLSLSSRALRERYGLLWYRLRRDAAELALEQLPAPAETK